MTPLRPGYSVHYWFVAFIMLLIWKMGFCFVALAYHEVAIRCLTCRQTGLAYCLKQPNAPYQPKIRPRYEGEHNAAIGGQLLMPLLLTKPPYWQVS